jgi:exonuclease SbcD
MNRVRDRFPHAVELRFAPEGRTVGTTGYTERLSGRGDLDVCCEFLDHVRGRPAGAGERKLLAEALAGARAREAEAS